MSLGRASEFVPSVLVAHFLDDGVRFALGPTIATRKAVLSEMGGLETVVNRIGSDYHIGHRAAALGYRVEPSHYVLNNDCSQETIADVFRRELRWSRTIRWNRGLQYYGLGITYGMVYALLLLAASGGQLWA